MALQYLKEQDEIGRKSVRMRIASEQMIDCGRYGQLEAEISFVQKGQDIHWNEEICFKITS